MGFIYSRKHSRARLHVSLKIPHWIQYLTLYVCPFLEHPLKEGILLCAPVIEPGGNLRRVVCRGDGPVPEEPKPSES